jgi:hypothetical protein
VTATPGQKWKGVFSPSVLRGRKAFIAVFLAMFFLGYNLTTSTVQQSSAQFFPGGSNVVPPAPTVSIGTCECCFVTCTPGTCSTDSVCEANCLAAGGSSSDCYWGCTSCTPEVCTTCPPPSQCDPAGTAATLVNQLIASLQMAIWKAAAELEDYMMNVIIPPVVQVFWLQVDSLEQDMIDWWKTMWYYNLKPSLQAMTRQLNIDLTQQTLTLQAAADATGELEINLALQKHAIEDRSAISPGPQVCVAATAASGYGRASNFSRAMRMAWENESVAQGLNEYGTAGAAGTLPSEAQRHNNFMNLFCDPDANGGQNNCTVTKSPAYAPFYNADVQATRLLFNKLTIDVNEDKVVPGTQPGVTIETILNNLMGVPSADLFAPGTLKSTVGQQGFLARRSYLARYAAARTVPQMVAGWRMPGSKAGDWVKELRDAVGVPASEISDNPSYKEIMHAVSVDRFNSGIYASNMITEENKIEMEKLTLDAFYLMQLRDYYELLERTALTLAVQVSLTADGMSAATADTAIPIK